MRVKKWSFGLGVAAAVASVVALAPNSAYADYAPSSSDVVGVGSDTLQNGIDFIADGDFLADPGYNAGKKNKFISIDATADSNARLSYGSFGQGPQCGPGTGATAGTGNQNTTHADAPCSQNPTVVLRAGRAPILRPNGSGAGMTLLVNDTNTTTGKSIKNLVDFARRSSANGTNTLFDSLQIGNDPLGMLTSSTSHAAKALSLAQVKAIYQCTVTDWSSVGGTAGTIKPLIPQAGSGTRNYFLQQLGNITPGPCVTAVEENDPEAIDASGDAINAVEPMSQSRLFLFQGKLSDGTDNGVGGYFHDPSCDGLSIKVACGGTGTASGASTPTLAPNVKLWTAADPAPSDSAAVFFPTRPLYIYFRHADITSTVKFQPGSTLNWIQTMLFNPGGATPYFCTGAGQALIAASGIDPACTYTASGP